METWLKRGSDQAEVSETDARVREAVERILDDVARRGDAAVREHSVRFDGRDRDDYRLTPSEIDACVARLGRRDVDDILFAQAQVRNFARHQREALRDVEVETLPGVVLGHKNIPVGSAGCYVPGGKYPLLASAHMSVLTAKVAGVPRVVTCGPAVSRRSGPGDRRGAAPRGRRRDLLPRRRPGRRRHGAGDAVDHPRRHAGRARQRVRCRGQAATLRASRDRRSLAGPTETLVIADEMVDGERCAPPTSSARPSTAPIRRLSC